MFCIFGRSRVTASKYVDKRLGDIKELKTDKLTQKEKQLLIDIEIDKHFETMKVYKCSHEVSTPELAKELFELMKDHKWFSDLKIMMKTPKILKSGKVSTSKTTGKTMMAWSKLCTTDLKEKEI